METIVRTKERGNNVLRTPSHTIPGPEQHDANYKRENRDKMVRYSQYYDTYPQLFTVYLY